MTSRCPPQEMRRGAARLPGARGAGARAERGRWAQGADRADESRAGLLRATMKASLAQSRGEAGRSAREAPGSPV